MGLALFTDKPRLNEAELGADGKWTGNGMPPGEAIYFMAADQTWQRYDPKTSKPPQGARWVISNEGQPTQAQVDALTNPPAAAPSLQDQVDALTSALQTKNVITSADLQAASATVATATTVAPATKV